MNYLKIVTVLTAMLLTSGCITSNSLYYFTPNERPSAPRTAIAETNSIALENKENLPTEIRKSVTYHKQDKRLLGTLNFRNDGNPEDPLAFQIRKEDRAYVAETPIGSSFKLGDKTVTPNFSMGLHKDHKGMVGITFRMPF